MARWEAKALLLGNLQKSSALFPTMSTMNALRNSAFALTAVFAIACSKQGKLEQGEYQSSDMHFRVGEPSSRYREINSDDALIALRNDDAGSTIAVNARCGLDGDDVPLSALVQHLFIQFTDRQDQSSRNFTLDDRAALEVESNARLDGIGVHTIIVVTKKNGCVYDFLHIDTETAEPSTNLAASREDFRSFVADFRVLD